MSSKTPISADRLAPEDLIDALKLAGNGLRPISGGTDLLIRQHSIQKSESHNLVKKQKNGFKPIFYAGRIKELCSINICGGSLRIGSGVTLTGIIEYPGCPPLLREALESIASPGIRNLATLTGNICNASPAGDSLPVLYILDALIETASIDDAGSIVGRKIPIADFITGPGRTSLKENELVTSVSFTIPEDYSGIFRKVGTRAANALSKLSIASVSSTGGEVIADFRLAVGACGPTVIRCPQAEKILNDCNISDIKAQIKDILSIYSAALSPIDDQRSTAEYRKNTALRIIENIILETGGIL